MIVTYISMTDYNIYMTSTYISITTMHNHLYLTYLHIHVEYLIIRYAGKVFPGKLQYF